VKSENKPRHITKGDVFDDLGLSRSEASALKVKATLLDAILGEIEKRGYTQSQLVEILDEYQPSVSNLTRGKIAKVSVEKLLTYSDRLQMKTTLTVHASSGAHSNARIHSGLTARSTTRGRSGSRRPRRQGAATGSSTKRVI
jgi:predicted XRE-type DNA-binding protein